MATHEDRFVNVLETKPPPREGDDQSFSAVEVDSYESPTTGQGAEPKPAPFTVKNMFEHHDAHSLVLSAALLRKFGPVWLDWEPETIWSEIKEEFRQQTISVHNRNKIQAVKLCHLLDTPWTEWEVFVAVCQAFNNNVPNFRVLQKPTIAQIMHAVSVMDKIRDMKFSEEVLKFIAACFLDEGVIYLPPPIDEAQTWATGTRYSCSDCGRKDRDDGDGLCDACGSSNITVYVEDHLDHRPIKKRFEQCVRLKDNRPELQETPEDVQTARLLVAHDYVVERKRQLKHQVAVTRDVRSYL